MGKNEMLLQSIWLFRNSFVVYEGKPGIFFFSLWYLQDRYEFRLFLEKKGNPGVHGSVLSSDHPLGGLLEPIPGAFSPVGLATFFKTKIITEELKVLEGK